MEQMKLYEIDEALEKCFDPETGEIIDPEAFAQLEEARDQKIEGIGCIIKNREALIDSMKNEMARLKDRVLTLEKQNENTKLFLDNVLAGRKFETARIKCTYRKSTAVDIADEKLVPAEYVTTKTTTSCDKTAIKAALVAGQVVPGCNLVERNNLSVK